MKPAYMGSTSVISIAAVIEDQELKQAIMLSDQIRNEALNRLCAMPGYKFKNLRWKNTYYEYWKKQVIKELERS